MAVITLVIIAGSGFSVSCSHHPDPLFNIGSKFEQPVSIYFNDRKVGELKPGESKNFYPNGVLTTGHADLMVEAQNTSGYLIYSRHFTWEELTTLLGELQGTPYWITYLTLTNPISGVE